MEGFVPWPSQLGRDAVLCPSYFGTYLKCGASIFRSHFPPGESKIFREISPNLNVGSQVKMKEEDTQ